MTRVFLFLLGTLVFSTSSFASRVFENFQVVETEVASVHNECREGCQALSSQAGFNSVQIFEADNYAIIRGDVTGFKLLQPNSAPFLKIDGPADLTLDLRQLQEAQRKTEYTASHPGDLTPDYYNGVASPFKGTLTADGKLKSISGDCYQHTDLGDLLTANRNFQCTVGNGLEKDVLVFKLVLAHK